MDRQHQIRIMLSVWLRTMAHGETPVTNRTRHRVPFRQTLFSISDTHRTRMRSISRFIVIVLVTSITTTKIGWLVGVIYRLGNVYYLHSTQHTRWKSPPCSDHCPSPHCHRNIWNSSKAIKYRNVSSSLFYNVGYTLGLAGLSHLVLFQLLLGEIVDKIK